MIEALLAFFSWSRWCSARQVAGRAGSRLAPLAIGK